MQYVFIVDIMSIIECFVLIGISTLPIIFSMTNDIATELNSINVCLRYKKMRLKMAAQFVKIIQFHSDTIQLSFSYFDWSITMVHKLCYFQIGTRLFKNIRNCVHYDFCIYYGRNMQFNAVNENRNGLISIWSINMRIISKNMIEICKQIVFFCRFLFRIRKMWITQPRYC